MTDHKFADDEIIELLNAYVERMCGKCNVKDLGTCCGTCFITAISQAADLINRQKAEIERLNTVHADMTESLRLAAEANKDMRAKIESLKKVLGELKMETEMVYKQRDAQKNRADSIAEFAKAEAIKEFAQRLKRRASMPLGTLYGGMVYLKDIDNLVKIMTEDNNGNNT